ncbi:MAG: DUF177 domain-containing protein [Synergistaceae bacterium]|nr:DUF177 domain-containing protein [Synergistaceae bacterium]
MLLTKKPSDWVFELETPELGEDTESTSQVWEKSVDSSLSYNGQIFSFKGPLKVYAEAQWADGGLSVEIAVEMLLSAQCSRCLAPADIDIMNDFMYLYTLRKKGSPPEDSGEEEIVFIPADFWKNTVDISDQVWETVMVSLPLQVICSPDCKGICPLCGKPLSEGECGCTQNRMDPRLEKLLDMKISDTEE